MILGSHNTMTYLPPKKWWMWFGRFMAKCQKLDYKKQYDAGVRFFDFRIFITTDKQGFYDPTFSHGLIDFKSPNPENILSYLNTKGDVYCRFIFEKGTEEEQKTFEGFVRQWVNEYKNLKIVQIKDKKTWKNLLPECVTHPNIQIVDCYASSNGSYPQYNKLPGILRSKSWSGLLIDDLYPWIYAKLNNKKNLEKYKDIDGVLLIDFVK